MGAGNSRIGAPNASLSDSPPGSEGSAASDLCRLRERRQRDRHRLGHRSPGTDIVRVCGRRFGIADPPPALHHPGTRGAWIPGQRFEKAPGIPADDSPGEAPAAAERLQLFDDFDGVLDPPAQLSEVRPRHSEPEDPDAPGARVQLVLDSRGSSSAEPRQFRGSPAGQGPEQQERRFSLLELFLPVRSRVIAALA